MLLFCLCACDAVRAQVASPAITRAEGVDGPSGISWVHLGIEGKLLANGPTPELPPMLTAQCTQTRDGKQKFELLADFGGVRDKAYYPPWRPKNKDDLFPPELNKVMLTMEFLGYTHVKPVKRQWVELQEPAGELKYNTPSMGSANMEQIMFYLQYLKALPTLRLSAKGLSTVEFMTTPTLDAIRREPMCKAAGL